MATMSDKPLGPGWWLASDGTWHPPELHPSMQGEAQPTAQTPDPSSLAPSIVAPVPTVDVAQVAPIAPMPPMETVAQVVPAAPVPQAAPVAPVPQVAPVAPVAQAVPAEPVPQVAPVTAEPSSVPVQTVAETPADAPEATVAMPGFGPVSPQPVPSLADMQSHPSWSGESDLRPSAGPMFPDMFQQAVADSQLVSAVAVNYGESAHQDSLDVLSSIGDAQLLEESQFRMPTEIGAFTGASAKKRRWHH
jgi:hypothetical protein